MHSSYRDRLLASLVLLAVATSASLAAPQQGQPKIPLENARCPVTHGAVKEDLKLTYKQGFVFFSTPDAMSQFEGNRRQFTERANLQLLATKQYEQSHCPLTGRPLNPRFGVNISGVTVHVCCRNCVLMSAQARPADQLKFFFTDQVFDRQYRVAPKPSP